MAGVTQLAESLPSKPPTAQPSVNPAETDVKGVPASGVKGEEKGEKMNDTKVREPDMNNPEEGARVERVKRALNILTYGNEQPPGAPDHTLSWGLSQWKIIARADGRSEKTVEGVEGAIKLLKDFLGDVPLMVMTSQEMRRFVIALRQRQPWQDHPYAKPQANKLLSPGAVNNRVRAIKSMFSTLARERFIEENPLRDYHAPGPGESIPATLTTEQMALLLSQPDQKRPEQFRDFVMMCMFYDSKCRLSELAAMSIDRLDLESEVSSFTVPGKGGHWLTYYFSRQGVKLLHRYLATRPAPALGVTSVFLRYDGQPLTEERMYRQVRHYGEKAGIKVHPHMFRHSGAREHLRHGGNLAELMVLLNHRTLRSTMIYSKLESEDARRAMMRFSPLDALGNLPGMVPKKKRGGELPF